MSGFSGFAQFFSQLLSVTMHPHLNFCILVYPKVLYWVLFCLLAFPVAINNTFILTNDNVKKCDSVKGVTHIDDSIDERSAAPSTLQSFKASLSSLFSRLNALV